MTAPETPVRRTRDYVRAVKADSLVRNSLYMMTTTLVTAGLGYVFWIVTARFLTSAQVGTASAVISLCTTVALLTYLGPWAAIIDRLHAYEGSREWYSVLRRFCGWSALVTAAACAAIVPLAARSASYGSFFRAPAASGLAVTGATAWTILNLISAAFIGARRADGLLSIQTLVSVVKVLFLIPVAAFNAGAFGLVGSWAGSALIGVAAGAAWLLPRLRLGHGPTVPPVRRYPVRRYPASRMIGQHLTSAGAAATPLILPVLVVLRLGVTPNAYFYVTWMAGGVFFMVSPSVAAALFAETARIAEGAGAAAEPGVVRGTAARALRVSVLLLIPAMLVAIAGGRPILGIFGARYASAGYGLLVVLALSALPDAVSNISVAVFRVTGRIYFAATINIGIFFLTPVGAWFLMPHFGIAGAGIAWLVAQVLGAAASLPAFIDPGRKVIT